MELERGGQAGQPDERALFGGWLRTELPEHAMQSTTVIHATFSPCWPLAGAALLLPLPLIGGARQRSAEPRTRLRRRRWRCTRGDTAARGGSASGRSADCCRHYASVAGPRAAASSSVDHYGGEIAAATG
eukprot:COSAG06_NODE_4746_length_3986_cov_24.001286_2_plen_130_part_00